MAKRNSNENAPFEHITMDLGAFIDSVSGGVYYTYLGSLTTPGKQSLFIPIKFNCFDYDCQRMIWTRPKLIYILGCNEVVTWVNFKMPIGISSSQVNILVGGICEYNHYWSWNKLYIFFTFLCWQLNAFRNLEGHDGNPLVDNFRPPQPLNGRIVGSGQFSD